MSTKPMTLEAPIAILTSAAIAAFAALTAALLPDKATTTTHLPTPPAINQVMNAAESITVTVNIMDDSKLRLICVAGAVGGAILSVLLFATPATTKQFAFKFLASGIAGVMFSPIVLRWVTSSIGIPTGTDVVLATSGAVALMSWGCLQMVVPIITKFTGAAARARFPSDPTS